MTEVLFEVRDVFDTSVTLTRRRWLEHIIPPTRHPEMVNYLDEVKQAIVSPDFVYRSVKNDVTKLFYRLNPRTGRYQGLLVVVVVRYSEEEGQQVGSVRTAYFTRQPSGGDHLLWIRSKL